MLRYCSTVATTPLTDHGPPLRSNPVAFIASVETSCYCEHRQGAVPNLTFLSPSTLEPRQRTDRMDNNKNSKNKNSDTTNKNGLLGTAAQQTLNSSLDDDDDDGKKNDEIPPPPSSSAVEWWGTVELGYELDDHSLPAPPVVCFACRVTIPVLELKRCAKCRVAAYCSRECQVSDWKRHKKGACAAFQRMVWTTTSTTTPQPTTEDAATPKDIDDYHHTDDPTDPHRPESTAPTPPTPTLVLRDESVKATIRTELWSKLRLYSCPYAVHHHHTLGKGFLLAQCTVTLAVASLATPQDWFGNLLVHPSRSVVLHYLTLGEFDVEVCREDFELATFRPFLVQALERYDPNRHVVVAMRFRCGHGAVGIAPLVPDYTVCEQLGRQYFATTGTDPLQLNLDDDS